MGNRPNIKITILWLVVILLIIIMSIFVIIICRLIFDINGNNDIWLGFWGSYLGALITLFCLFLTIAYNRYNLWLDKEHKRIEKVKEDLIKRVGVIRIREFLEKPFAYWDNLDIPKQALYLLELSGRYQTEMNTADLLYGTSISSERQRAFHYEYTKCLKKLNTQIEATLYALYGENPKGTIQGIALLNILAPQASFAPVRETAANYIKELDERYQSILNWGPWKITLFMFQKQDNWK